MPVCRVCSDDKKPEEFPWRDAKKGVRQYQCLACARARSRAWYKKNAEHHRTRVSNWRLENPDAARQHRENNRDKYRAWDHQWRHANPATRRAAKAAYRAKKKQRTLQLSPQHHKMLKDYYRRARELTAKTGVLYHCDHIVPLSGENVCGLHVPWNLQIIPAKLNMKKSNALVLTG
jgi:hypothetical protein